MKKNTLYPILLLCVFFLLGCYTQIREPSPGDGKLNTTQNYLFSGHPFGFYGQNYSSYVFPLSDDYYTNYHYYQRYGYYDPFMYPMGYSYNSFFRPNSYLYSPHAYYVSPYSYYGGYSLNNDLLRGRSGNHSSGPPQFGRTTGIRDRDRKEDNINASTSGSGRRPGHAESGTHQPEPPSNTYIISGSNNSGSSGSVTGKSKHTLDGSPSKSTSRTSSKRQRTKKSKD